MSSTYFGPDCRRKRKDMEFDFQFRRKDDWMGKADAHVREAMHAASQAVKLTRTLSHAGLAEQARRAKEAAEQAQESADMVVRATDMEKAKEAAESAEAAMNRTLDAFKAAEKVYMEVKGAPPPTTT